ncbi:MAG: hypothetical protein Q8P46_15500 [Hyphomicrobiales bacterium]|nr:hypothetical protein [Hyphomicrobiales bacterium]
MGRFEEVAHARSAWLKENRHHQFAYQQVGKYMRVVAGKKVIATELTMRGFCKDWSDSDWSDCAVFDSTIFGIPVEVDEENSERFEIIQRPMEDD